MDNMDPAFRDDADTGEGTDGRESTNKFKDISTYKVDDEAVDSTDELANE